MADTVTTLARPAAINPFEPQSLDQAMVLAKTMAASGLMPSALRNKPADILIVLMAGRELGIGPMQSVQDINVIQGKPVYSADLMVALCKRNRSVCEFFRLVEATDERATYETKRVGSPHPESLTFTMEDAKRLGLTGRDNYQKQPKTMLRHRAAAALARDVYPDLVRGYDPDEALDFAQPAAVVDVNPPPAKAAPVVVPVLDAETEHADKAKAAALANIAAAAQVLDVTPPPAHTPEQAAKVKVLFHRAKTAHNMTPAMLGEWVTRVLGSKKPSAEWTESDITALSEDLNAAEQVNF